MTTDWNRDAETRKLRARITREINRRVEARGVVLRSVDDDKTDVVIGRPRFDAKAFEADYARQWARAWGKTLDDWPGLVTERLLP